MAAPKILVLYNQPLSASDHPASASERMVVSIAEFMAELVKELGYRSSILGLGPEPNVLWRELRKRKPDAVLNLYEGTLDDAETETYVAGILAWSGIPFTGCPPRTLTLARAKHLAKMVMKAGGLPTADFLVVDREPIPAWPGRWPVIVKPAAQDASVGIEHGSVCQNADEYDARVRLVLERFGSPALVEEFIPGRELIVAVTELPDLRAMPPAEILFPSTRPGAWPILTYESKWNPGSPDYDTTPPRYPAEATDELKERLEDLSRRAFRLLGCRDYARIDFRVNDRGEAYVLEVNPNPEISDDACFGYILESAGIPFPDFIRNLIEQTLKRKPARP